MFHKELTMKRQTVLLALWGALAGCAATQLPDEPKWREYSQPQWVSPMKSGMRVLVEEDHSAPLVTVVSVVGVGGTGDPKGKEGLAHFIEHLVFRSRFAGGEPCWEHLNRLGGNPNATTGADFTTYFTTVHKDNLHQLMQLEAWRLARTIEGVTPEVFKIEREVVRNELRQRRETTIGNKMFDLLLMALFPPGHPLARPMAGTHESLLAASLDDAKAFVKEHYRADNYTVVISGDVRTEDVKRELGMWPPELLFGPGGPEGPPVPPRPRASEKPPREIPPPFAKSMQRHKGPVTQPELFLAWALPGAFHGKDALAQFAAARLNLAVAVGLDVREEDDIEGVAIFPEELVDSSLMVMSATLKPGADPEKVRRRLLDVLVDAWTTELGPLQTEGSRWSAATGLLFGAASPIGKGMQVAEYMGATGKTSFFKDRFEELAQVKPTDVTDFAAKWLTRERAVAVYFEPESERPPAVLGGGGGAGGAGERRASHDLGKGEAGSGAEYTAARIREVARSPGLAQVPRFKLANGLEVYVIKQGEFPIAQIELGIKGGDASVRPVGMASLAAGLAPSKCRDHGSLTPVGGRSAESTGSTSTTAFVRVLSGNLANGVAVLSDNVSCREVDAEAFLGLPRMLENEGKVYQRLIKRPEFVAARKMSAELYPGHPFAEVLVDPESLKAVKAEDAQAFVRGHFRPENAVAVVFGDVEMGEVKALAEKYLTRWQGGAGAVPMSAPPAPPGPQTRKLYLIDRPGATQALVNVACRLPEVKPDRLPAYDLLESLATEKAAALREQWGATYGVYARVTKRPGGAADLSIDGAVETAQVGRSTARLLDLVAELGRGDVADGMFLTKRWDVARGFANQYVTAGALANAIVEAAEQGWPLEALDRYPENLAATTKATIKELARPCVGKEVATIVGDAAVLKPQLEKEGLKLEGK
jgi:zinc protease